MLSIFQGKRPDITPAQVIGLVPVIATLLSAFGFYDLTPEQQDALEKTVLAVGFLFGADAAIRIGRNVADAKKTVAVLGAKGEPADRTLEIEVVAPPAAVVGTAGGLAEERPVAADEIEATLGPDDDDPDPDVAAVPDEALPSDEEELAGPPPGVA